MWIQPSSCVTMAELLGDDSFMPPSSDSFEIRAVKEPMHPVAVAARFSRRKSHTKPHARGNSQQSAEFKQATASSVPPTT